MKSCFASRFARTAVAAVGCGFVTLAFVACGDDVTKVYENQSFSVLESGEKLSKKTCDSSNVGEILYAKDSLKTFVCDGDSWKSLGSKDTVYVSDTTKNLDKIGCSAKKIKKKNRNGIEITCGKNVIDTLWNGENGDNGSNASCRVENKENTVSIVCGEGDDAVSTVVLNLCNGTRPYNPETELCDQRDGSVYGLVKIAGAKVMNRNLNYKADKSFCGGGISKSSDYYPEVRSSWEWAKYYDETEYGDCEEYGRLYSYKLLEKAGSSKSLCPAGSRLPKKSEVVKLALADKKIFNYMDSKYWREGKYKEEMNDKYDLGVRAAGYYYALSYKDGEKVGFYTKGTGAGFWVTDGDDLLAYYWRYTYGDDYVLKIENAKNYGFSVRCVME